MSDFTPPTNSDTTFQTQPFNQQAEEAVLGAVLIDPESYAELAQILQPEHFYVIRNGWIWQAYSNLFNRQVPIDLLTVSEELEKHDQLNDTGGQPYLISLVNQTPTSVNAEAYAKIVEDNFIRRRILQAANDLAKMAFNQEKQVDGILDSAEKSIFGLSERRIRHDVVPIQRIISDYYNRVSEASQQKDEIFGLPTDLKDLDTLLGGMQNSDLIIVAGRPGSGKTGFLLTVANNVALHRKKHVAFFSMEMSNEQLLQRLLAQVTGINTQRLRSGKIKENEWEQFTEGIEILNNIVIFLDDTPSLTPIQLRTKCRRLDMEHKLDLVVIDYIQLMVGDARTENRVQEVSYISRNLKALAKELKVPVLAAAQLSRASEMRDQNQQKRKDEPKEYRLSDLRESGSLEQDADVVMFIDHDPKKEGISRLIVAKHRNGPTNETGIEVVFRSDLTKFDNALTRIDQTTLERERAPRQGKTKP
jgi:replicative DNA helicase